MFSATFKGRLKSGKSEYFILYSQAMFTEEPKEFVEKKAHRLIKNKINETVGSGFIVLQCQKNKFYELEADKFEKEGELYTYWMPAMDIKGLNVKTGEWEAVATKGV